MDNRPVQLVGLESDSQNTTRLFSLSLDWQAYDERDSNHNFSVESVIDAHWTTEWLISLEKGLN
jgi:hypothetical protein